MTAGMGSEPASSQNSPKRLTGLREQKKQRTRHAIHEAAVRLVEERGMSAVTVESICETAMISSRTFFNYFPSKAAAVLGLTELFVPVRLRTRFLESDNEDVLADLCEVVAGVLTGEHTQHGERFGTYALSAQCPELTSTMLQRLISLNEELYVLTAGRISERHAKLLVDLVLCAVADLASTAHELSCAPFSARLYDTVHELSRVTVVCSPAHPAHVQAPDIP